MSNDPIQLKDILETALKSCHLDDSITKFQVEEAYRNIVGEMVTQLTYSARYDVKSHTLYLKLASPALRQEFSFKTESLIEAINKKLPAPAVQKIVIS